jgi:hypothetical protein
VDSEELVRGNYIIGDRERDGGEEDEKKGRVGELRGDWKGTNRGLVDCSKAFRMLGWKEEGFPWKA